MANFLSKSHNPARPEVCVEVVGSMEAANGKQEALIDDSDVPRCFHSIE